MPTAVPAEREFLERGDRLLGAAFSETHLLRVAAEFLAEPDRRRVHQMGATDLDHVVKFRRFGGERGFQFFERRNEALLELLGRADVDRGWDHVVARLPHVDVIVRVNRIARADRFAGQLAAAVRDHFVRVRVRARAGTGLENVERKMFVELALGHFFRGLHDERAALRIEQTKIVIGLRGRPFDQTERANERPRKTLAADREIQDRALRRSAVERGFRDGHFAHRILFHAGLAGTHAVRWTVIFAGRRRDPGVTIARLRFLENRDEHRRNILQEILRLGAIEQGGVLPEFVRDLVDDEGAAIGQRIVGFLEQGALFS